MASVHDDAKEGFKDAATYDAHRPSYPPEAVDKLLAHLDIARKSRGRVVEIAAGTGKFTESLARRPEKYDVIAVEPHGPMREQLEAKRLPGVRVVDGLAAKMPIENEWGDAAIAAQAFHWFAEESSLREIRRVLSPDSKFGMIWNLEDYNKPKDWPSVTKWGQGLNDLLFMFPSDDQNRFRDGVWREVFERQRDTVSCFSLPLGEEKVMWTVWLTEEALWKRYSTLSHVAMLKGQEREEFYGKFKKVLNEASDLEKNGKGEIALHGVTYFAWISRL